MAKIDSKEASAWGRLLVTGAGIWAAWEFIAKPVLEIFNLKDTKEEKDNAKQDIKPATANPWDPNYKNLTPQAAVGGTRMLVPNSIIGNYLDTIWNARPLYWPLIRPKNYEAVAGVIRGVKYQTQISDIADYFQRKYSQDLYKFLLENFSGSEVASLNAIVKAKPSGWFSKTGKAV